MALWGLAPILPFSISFVHVRGCGIGSIAGRFSFPTAPAFMLLQMADFRFFAKVLRNL
jgi:hypothetical protein